MSLAKIFSKIFLRANLSAFENRKIGGLSRLLYKHFCGNIMILIDFKKSFLTHIFCTMQLSLGRAHNYLLGVLSC